MRLKIIVKNQRGNIHSSYKFTRKCLEQQKNNKSPTIKIRNKIKKKNAPLKSQISAKNKSKITGINKI